jgi:hypothetical protein
MLTTAVFSVFFCGATAPSGSGPPHCQGLTITLRHTTLGRTPLDEWSARRTDLYLTTQNTHKRQTPMCPAGFEPATPASERPQTNALDRATTGIICSVITLTISFNYAKWSVLKEYLTFILIGVPQNWDIYFHKGLINNKILHMRELGFWENKIFLKNHLTVGIKRLVKNWIKFTLFSKITSTMHTQYF